ncbi:MAG: DUF308 domain-containing protein [Actinomycetota bacterium]
MSDAELATSAEVPQVGASASSSWWLPLVTGIAWILFAFVVLSFDVRTVYAVAAFFGVGLVVGGLTDLAIASWVTEWRWLHVVLGVIELGAGTIALVWPDRTFLVLAALVGWFLMLVGLIDIVIALSTRKWNELWWLGLLVGVLAVAVGLWATGYAGRSIALLVFWVGATALVRGCSQLVLAFGLRAADSGLGHYLVR